MAAKLVGERLPDGWSYSVTRDGRIFFVDDISRTTSWLHPLTGEPVLTGHSIMQDDDSDLDDDLPHDLDPGGVTYAGLPPGWEQAQTTEGIVYFIDHNQCLTTFESPVSRRPGMEGPTRTPPQSPNIKAGPSRRSGKSRNLKPPTASRGENSKVILRGWLHKQESGGLKLWKKKWCVLADFGLFFYKDDSEQNCIGSILLPSYVIKPCSSAEINKKFAFKAEHENMKTFYFSTDGQTDMDRWVSALTMAALVQKAPGSGHMPKLIPKSPFMSWNDSPDSPPTDMQQFPFGNPNKDTSRTGSDLNDSYRDRSPLQPRENTRDYNRGAPNESGQWFDRSYDSRDPRDDRVHDDRGSQMGSQRGSYGGDYGSLSRPGQGHVGQRPYDQNPNKHNDPRYPPDRGDRMRGSQRSNLDQHSLPDDQRSRSLSGMRPGQYSSSTLPKGSGQKPDYRDGDLGANTGQGYNSLPRDSRSRLLPPGEVHEGPYSHSSPRQTLERPQRSQGQRKEDNPYMAMSPQSIQGNKVQKDGQKKMDPYRHSNRPLPQEPPPEPIHERNRSGGGDYASLTRIRDKWPNQNLSQSSDQTQGAHNSSQGSHNSSGGAHNSSVPMSEQRPDLYVDIPHTYVNVYDQSQVPDRPPELPSRPPLPTEVRHKIVEDIAMTHSPNTQKEMLVAENNLEFRMNQPAFFHYPTPTRESLPPLPQDSPRSQRSHRSSTDPRSSHDPRSNTDNRSSSDPRPRYPDDRDRLGVPAPRRPELVPLSSAEAPVVKQTVRDNSMSPPDTYEYKYHVSKDSEGSDITLTNEDRNDRISEFYGLGKYNEKANNRYNDKNRFMSDMDVRAQTLPSKQVPVGRTGEKDFRLRSLPDHVQSMPAIYHDQQQPQSMQTTSSRPVVNSYMNLTPPNDTSDSRLHIRGDNDEQQQRRSAFRPLSAGSNSLQRFPSGEQFGQNQSGDSGPTPPGDYSKHPRYSDQGRLGDYKSPGYSDQTDRKRLSEASSQMSQPGLPWKQDTLPGQLRSDVPDRGQGQQRVEGQQRGQGHRGQRAAPAIHTVKEDPDMPDEDVLTTDLPKRVFALSGPRLRMSISAGDLLGKTHDELVLLLIQLRRDKADLTEQRDSIRNGIEQGRPGEFYYRKLQSEGRPIDGEKEVQHRKYQELKHKLDDIEKRVEVYKPLVNLVCNMVTMGSLYGGDNFMLATEYRKHLLSPDQYSPPKKMIEFSRRHQEDRIIQEIEEDVQQLTKDQADLEEKQDRLYDLDRIIQEQSFQVTSLKEDRELLEKALGGLLKKQDQNCTNTRELERLLQEQRTVEKELSRVLQQLAEASKELEETTAENNKIEHEVALLRTKVIGDMSRSKSAPSLSSENLRTKMKMEKDLAKVQNIMSGLSEEGARLKEVMSSLRRNSPGDTVQKPTSSRQKHPDSRDQKSSSKTTYFETDMDSNESKDLAQVTAVLASYKLSPRGSGHLSPELVSLPSSPYSPTHPGGAPYRSTHPPSREEGTSAFKTVSPSSKGGVGDSIFHASPFTQHTAQPAFSQQVSQPTFVQQVSQPTFSQQMSQPTYTQQASEPTFVQQASQPQLESGVEMDGADQWDIGGADDNTKRFFGLIPKNMPKSQTVRDVKRHSESRREGKKKDDDSPLHDEWRQAEPNSPLRVGVIPSSSPDYTDSNFHVYENLPQQKSTASSDVPATAKYPWSSVSLENDNPTAKERRRSATHLMAPKPFTSSSTPYSSISNVSSSSYDNQNTQQPISEPNTQSSQSQVYNSSNSGHLFEINQSNDSTASTEPIAAVNASGKTPPPPPVRGTSKMITAEVSQHHFASLPHLNLTSNARGQTDTDGGTTQSPRRNYVTPIPTILKKSKSGRGTQKGRYLTISSSQPIKMEQNLFQTPKHNSQAGDLISSMDVPDIVKSSTTKMDQIDERTIEREVLYFPEKVEIPERYMPDSDEEESLTEEEKAQRREKADKIKRILTQQSVHSLSQPDVSKVAGEVHERVQQEKLKRAQLLGINQELAEQVKRKSRQFAAERRKTWSGTTHKPENTERNGDLSDGDMSPRANSGSYGDDSPRGNTSYQGNTSFQGDANNNSYSTAYPADVDRYADNNISDMYYPDDMKRSYLYGDNTYTKGDNSTGNDPYATNNYSSMGDNSGGGDDGYRSLGFRPTEDSPYISSGYRSNVSGVRPNFKI